VCASESTGPVLNGTPGFRVCSNVSRPVWRQALSGVFVGEARAAGEADRDGAHGRRQRAPGSTVGVVSFLGDAKSWLGDAKSSLGDATSSLGDAKSSLGDAKSSLGDAKSSLGDAKSSLGDPLFNFVYTAQLADLN
jgi:hypothetical protein